MNDAEDDIKIISYRLKEIESNLEKNIEKLSNKIDLLLEQLNKTALAQSETKVKVNKLEEEVSRLIKVDDEIKQEISNIKVSVAEKLGWGAIGGTISAAIIKILGG